MKKEVTIIDKEANRTYGAVKEAMHIAGYAITRGFNGIMELLGNDQWRFGGEFNTVREFIDSVPFSQLQLIMEQKKQIWRAAIEADRKELSLSPKQRVSNRQLAKALNVAHTQINRDTGTNVPSRTKNASKNKPSDSPSGTNVPPSLSGEEVARLADKTIKIAEQRKAKEEARKIDLERTVNVALAQGLHHGDFRELSYQIRDESAQLVLVDPPYDEESISLFEDAAKAARRILKPNGSFLTYSGQRFLPQVMMACSRHLDYWWTIACIHRGGNQILQKLGIRCGWKPILWFVKGSRGNVQNIILDTVSGNREKDDHEWQQSELEALFLIEKLTTPAGLVVDFFAGSGTTGAAAKKLHRQWIGFEINATSAEVASERLAL